MGELCKAQGNHKLLNLKTAWLTLQAHGFNLSTTRQAQGFSGLLLRNLIEVTLLGCKVGFGLRVSHRSKCTPCFGAFDGSFLPQREESGGCFHAVAG